MAEENQIPSLLRGNRVIIVVLVCLAFTALLFWYETSNAPISFSEISWTSSSIWFLLLALVAMAFRDLAYMVRIRLLTNKKLSWKQAFDVIMIWEFASALSPGVVGGTAVAMFILKGEKVPLGKATAIVIVTAIMDNLFYILALPILFFFISNSYLFPETMEWYHKGGASIFWIGYGIVAGATLLLFISVFFAPVILKGLINLLFKLPILRRRKQSGDKIVSDIYTASEELKSRSFGFWLQVFGATVWSWTSRFLVINFVLMAFMELGLMDHLVVLGRQLVMWLVLIIPSSPGGSGLAEFLFTEFLSDFIQNGALALGLALVWRTISYYPYLLIGSIIYPRWMRR